MCQMTKDEGRKMMKPLWMLSQTELAHLAVARCADCAGTGIAEDGEPCACCDTFETAVARANFPPRWETATLADVQWEAIQPANVRTGLQTYAADLERYLDENLGLFLSGPVGCGKTHLAIGIGKLACALGYTVHFVSVPAWFQALRDSYAETRQPRERALMQPLQKTALLILDDLGAERASDWGRERLYVVVNQRSVQQLPTLVTTNESLTDLEAALGPRTLSRLCGDALVFTLAGDDYRQIQKRERLARVHSLAYGIGRMDGPLP